MAKYTAEITNKDLIDGELILQLRYIGDDGIVMEKEFKAPAHFLVKAGVEHEITALEDDTTYWCVFSLRDSEGRVVQEFDGWHTY